MLGKTYSREASPVICKEPYQRMICAARAVQLLPRTENCGRHFLRFLELLQVHHWSIFCCHQNQSKNVKWEVSAYDFDVIVFIEKNVFWF